MIFCPAFRSSSVRRFSSKSPNRQTEAPLPLDAVVMALSPRVERKALLQARSTPPRRARAAHCSSGRARQGDLECIMDQAAADRIGAVSSATRARRGSDRKGWFGWTHKRLAPQAGSASRIALARVAACSRTLRRRRGRKKATCSPDGWTCPELHPAGRAPPAGFTRDGRASSPARPSLRLG